MQIALLFVSNTPLIVILCNCLSIGANDNHSARLKVYLLSLNVQRCNIVIPLMLLNVNTYVNSVIESLFALMKFMKVLMNVYLPYSFNH